LALALCSAVPLAGCIDVFDGSRVELLLAPDTQVPGDPSGFGRPPSDTHYEMYAARDSNVFYITSFEIRPIVDISAPCFIEDENSTIPYGSGTAEGLHVTAWYDKLFEVYNADGMISDDEAGALADARRRVGGPGLPAGASTIELLQNNVKAVVASEFSPDSTLAEYQELQDDLATLAAAVPPTTDISDQASADRLALCQAFFAKHPSYYVGADRLITLPLNGHYLGTVKGMDPRNNSFLGGATLEIDTSFPELDALRINWQFNNRDDTRAADYGGPQLTGYHYMAGTPLSRERGVINVPMQNVSFSNISGEAAIFTLLRDDDVHF